MHDSIGSFLRGWLLTVALCCIAPMASAVTILEPQIVFTERYIFALDRIENDQSAGSTGYLGLISNVSGWEDRTFIDFNLIDASPA